MANEAGWSYWSVIPRIKPGSVKGIESQLNGSDFQRAGRKAGDDLGRNIGTGARSRVSSMSKSILAPLLAGVAAVKVKDFLGGSLDEARESQKVGALTAQVIKTTGGAAKVTAKEVGRLSTALSNKTGIDDENIQSSANLLLTFKAVRNEAGLGNDIFNQAVKTQVDLAATMKTDTRSAALQLGKALQDPIKGVAALGRAGVQFTADQKEQIKGYVESNDLLSAQKLILSEVKSQVDGAAAAQATMGEKSKVAYDNIKEGIGTALLPLVDDLERAFLEKGVPAAEQFTEWFQSEGIPAIRDFNETAGPLAKSVLPALGTGLGVAADAAKALAPAVKSIVDSFNSLPKSVQTAIVLGGGAAYLGGKVTGGLPGGGGKKSSLLGGAAGLGATAAAGAGGSAAAAGSVPAAAVVGGVLATAITLAVSYELAKQIKNNIGKGPSSTPPGLMGYTGGDGKDSRSAEAIARQNELIQRKNIEYAKQADSVLAANAEKRRAEVAQLADAFGISDKAAGKLRESLYKAGATDVKPYIDSHGLKNAGKQSEDLLGLLGDVDKRDPKVKVTADTKKAKADVSSFKTLLDLINPTKNVTITTTRVDRGSDRGKEARGSSGGGRVRMFDGGGWTGPGSRLQPAGVVHADEFVVRKSSRQRAEKAAPGGLDMLNQTGEWPAMAGPQITEAGLARANAYALADVLSRARFVGPGGQSFYLRELGG